MNGTRRAEIYTVARLDALPAAAQVVCLDKMDYCSSLHNLDQVKDKPNFKMVKGNLLSADLMNYVLETEQIDTIIHAAAQVALPIP